MSKALKISDAATLAIHALTALAVTDSDDPVKLPKLAGLLRASEAHLGKIMHRLVQAELVESKRGPHGGFLLGDRALSATLLDIYEMFDGPLGHDTCLLGYEECPFGRCVLGNALHEMNELLYASLGGKTIGDLVPSDDEQQTD